MTLIAANKAQAAEMLKDVSEALEGINLELLAEKCSALWSKAPEGSNTEKIELGNARIPIKAELIILGQEVAFRKDSNHCFDHRLRQAWKAAHANAPRLRSTAISHTKRVKLLQALVKPCLLYGVETWKVTPDLISKIITAERALTRWCLRMSIRSNEEGDETLEAWIRWKVESAREIARIMEKQSQRDGMPQLHAFTGSGQVT